MSLTRKPQSEKQSDVPPTCQAMSLVTVERAKEPRKEQNSSLAPGATGPSTRSQPNEANSAQDASGVAALLMRLITVHAKQSEVKQKRQELANIEAGLDTEANNLVSLILLKTMGTFFPQTKQ